MLLPHTGVYTRLGKSEIHGIGVFAIIDIPKDTPVFLGDENTETINIPASEINNLPQPIRKLYTDFCPLNDGIYTCPTNFNNLTVSWYLNCSKNPNVNAKEGYIFYTIRDIKADEELTVDYDTYSE